MSAFCFIGLNSVLLQKHSRCLDLLFFTFLGVFIPDTTLQWCWPGYLWSCTSLTLQALWREFSAITLESLRGDFRCKHRNCAQIFSCWLLPRRQNLNCDILLQLHNSTTTNMLHVLCNTDFAILCLATCNISNLGLKVHSSVTILDKHLSQDPKL